ncbi:hypothetical protein E4K10_25195 [Streptomyces sp. T1317-0309]|nr:hypothetical protein E4K10_25195 [Streptomyces sp. T1317-0309]
MRPAGPPRLLPERQFHPRAHRARRPRPRIPAPASPWRRPNRPSRWRRCARGTATSRSVPLRRGRRAGEWDDLVVRPLLVDRLVGLVPEGHRLARAESVAIGELRGTVDRGLPALSWATGAGMRDAGFTPRIDFATDDYPAVVGLVGAGLGVAVLPQLASSPCGRGVRGPSPWSPRYAGDRRAHPAGSGTVPAVAATLEELARAARR